MLLNNVIVKHTGYGYCKVNIHINENLIENVEILDANLVEFSGCDFFITPGFVNSHLHPNQLFDRRRMDELSINELLHQMHGNHQKDDEDRYAQALFVLIDAVKAGATSIYAVASNPYPVIKAFKTLDIKGAITCFYNDLWEGHGDSPALSVHHGIEERFLQAYKEKTEMIDIHIGSASIQSASNDLLVLMNNLSKKVKTKVNLHVSEGIESVQSCIKSRGTTPVRLLDKLGILSKNWNLIHAVNIDEEEIALIAKAMANVIYCPVSNAKTGVGIAPIKALMNLDTTIGLGTDACSNNNTNNILNEAYFGLLLQSAVHNDPKVITVDKLMHFLISNGHKILGTPGGVIEPGQPADLLLWSLHENVFVPVSFGNFESALIYNAPDIKPHTVLINGKIIVENYKCIILPEEEIRNLANQHGAKFKKLNLLPLV
jgi:5-methylthioadenosine/S-adenosylhomocysteine deaminase